MISPRCWLLALLAAAPVSSRAQPSASPPAPAGRCQQVLQSVPIPLGDVTAEALPDGGCQFDHVVLHFSSLVGYAVDRLTEHGVPAAGLSPDQKLDAQVQASGVRFVLNTPNRNAALMSRLQQVPFDVGLDLAVDPEQDRADLRKLTMDGFTVGHVLLSAALTGFKADPSQAALTGLHFHLDSRSFLTAFVVPTMVGMLPPGDPQAFYDRAQAGTIEKLRALLPLTAASPETIDAMVAFATEFPHPRHVLDLTVAASAPVSLADVTAATSDASRLLTVLHRLTVTATYTGDPH